MRNLELERWNAYFTAAIAGTSALVDLDEDEVVGFAVRTANAAESAFEEKRESMR
jgi:hypothetical protein